MAARQAAGAWLPAAIFAPPNGRFCFSFARRYGRSHAAYARCMGVPDDAEVAALLDTVKELLNGMRRLSDLSDRLITRAGDRLTRDEAQDARRELETSRAGIEKLEAMLLLRRQRLRPM
jgi:hypothetical protein